MRQRNNMICRLPAVQDFVRLVVLKVNVICLVRLVGKVKYVLCHAQEAHRLILPLLKEKKRNILDHWQASQKQKRQ